MVQFIGPVLDRNQYVLIQDTLDQTIPQDAPVRLFDMVLGMHDWSDWESQYYREGRPAYPPEAMAKLLVYAYSKGMRSSRGIEDACRYRVDYIWLMGGRVPDHDTICVFRRKNKKELKGLFKGCLATCQELGLVSLEKLIVDGTRVRANNSDAGTATLGTITERLQKIESALRRMDDGSYGNCDICGKPIEKARVKALPYVDLCIKDAQAQSRR